MTFREIQQQLDLFQDLIVKSHAIITDGRFVDTSRLDLDTKFLFNQIKGQCSGLSKKEMVSLSASIETLLSHFDKLTDALDNQNNSLSTESIVSPRKVIAAYKR